MFILCLLLPGKLLPGKLLPGIILPCKLLHGKLLPGKLLHGKLLPGMPLPSKLLPGKLFPVKLLPGKLLLIKLINTIIVYYPLPLNDSLNLPYSNDIASGFAALPFCYPVHGLNHLLGDLPITQL